MRPLISRDAKKKMSHSLPAAVQFSTETLPSGGDHCPALTCIRFSFTLFFFTRECVITV